MYRLWAAFAVIGLGAGLAGATSPDPQTLKVPPQDLSKARELVQKLGSSLFRERERAQDELAGMGRLARVALLEAVSADPSPEVRARSAQLLPRAEAADLQARIDTFLADTEAKFEHDIPAWTPFRKAVVDKEDQTGAAARGLFIEMLKSRPNLDLLIALNGSPAEAGRVIADRRLEMFFQANPQLRGQFNANVGVTRTQMLTLTDVAAILFAEIVVPSKDIPKPGPFAGISGATFAQQAVAMNAINNPSNNPHSETYRRLLIKWIETRTGPDELANMVTIVSRMPQMKEAGAILRRIVETEGVHGWAKAQAVIALAQKNGKDEQAFLKTLLTSEAIVGNIFLGQAANGMAKLAPCQLRDVALAMLIAQSGQTLKDYGYESASFSNQDPMRNPHPTYAFQTDEDRAKAFKMWAAWEAKKADKTDMPKK